MQANLFPAIPTEVQARIDKALADPSLTGCARAVLIVLSSRPAVGRARAISIADLQRVFRYRVHGETAAGADYSDRQIKGSVRELIAAQGIPVGSARSAPCGYYLAVTDDEMEEIAEELLTVIRAHVDRYRCFAPKSTISRVLCGQLGMGEGNGFKNVGAR